MLGAPPSIFGVAVAREGLLTNRHPEDRESAIADWGTSAARDQRASMKDSPEQTFLRNNDSFSSKNMEYQLATKLTLMSFELCCVLSAYFWMDVVYGADHPRPQKIQTE